MSASRGHSSYVHVDKLEQTPISSVLVRTFFNFNLLIFSYNKIIQNYVSNIAIANDFILCLLLL